MAAFTQLSDLFQLLWDQLPGVDDLILTRECEQALRQFCDDSNAWREKLAAIDLVVGQRDYTLTPSYDCRIKQIAEVRILTANDVTYGYPGTKQPEDNYSFVRPSTLTLKRFITPRVAVTGGLVVKVILVPEHLQTGNNVVSAAFLNDYAVGIMERVLYVMKLMPRQRWSDPDKAVKVHLFNYRTAITDAMADLQLENKLQPDNFEG